MNDVKPTIVVTGVSGNLGLRLLPMLKDFQVIGIDLKPPETSHPCRFFASMDLGLEESCHDLLVLLREFRPSAVVHLAFVLDPVRTGIWDLDRMWQINVAGTARVMEAISEANRDQPVVQKFVFPSSVAAYGSDLATAVTEDAPLSAHTLPYALHKMESDKVVQERAPALRGCSVYMLRPHLFAGISVQNYMIGAFRGTPDGKSERAARMRHAGKRLPCLLPMGQKYLDNRIQFVHVDDAARLVAYILNKTQPESQRLTVLNVAGSGEPLTFGRCIELAHAPLKRVPGEWTFRLILEALWKLGISAIPPEALPYMTGEYIMNTDRLQRFLGHDYKDVIRFSVVEAFEDSFAASPQPAQSQAASHSAAFPS
jgi:nucleoside-diphosphate-sugar epimerase